MTARGRRVVLMTATLAPVSVLLSACDDFRDVSLDNACGYRIEAAMDPSSRYPWLIEDGANEVVSNNGGGPFDVVLRRAGTADWTVKIKWDRLKESSEDNGIPFVVEGADCPT